jgi:AraC family transcriptional regulator of adaptative response/methylated-DNA-[protein]-cysteine methyltransferase
LAKSPRGICHIAFVENNDPAKAELDLQESWPAAILIQDDKVASRWAASIFHQPTTRERPRLKAYVRGSEFQVRVWRALLTIPPGVLMSYGRLAASIGQPTASRAVGSAVGHNPLAYLIPCHRVIRETGVIGDYHWGPLRKRAMIVWETMPTSQLTNLKQHPGEPL